MRQSLIVIDVTQKMLRLKSLTMDIDHNVSLVGLPDPAISNIIGYLDDKSLFDLSWSNSFWLHRLDNDEYWRQLLVNQLEGIDIETCNRLCTLSGLCCKSLAMSIVATRRHEFGRTYAEVVDAADTRTLGLITFLPARLDLHNNDERLRQACVDVTRWGLAVAKICFNLTAQFLWEGRHGRAELLVTVFCGSDSNELSDIRYSDITVDGVSVYTFEDRNAFADDVVRCIFSDCHFMRLDADAPSQFAWMNSDQNLDSFENVRNRVTRETILAITEANIGITLGMLRGDGDYDEGIHYDYQSARFNALARKLNPNARYALTCHHKDETCNLYSILNELFEVAKVDPSFLGGMVPMDAYLKASEWPGWPFNLQSDMFEDSE